jgi:FG-GAP-like repeat
MRRGWDRDRGSVDCRAPDVPFVEEVAMRKAWQGVGLILSLAPPLAAQDLPQPILGMANYGHDAGGWRVEQHPRLLGDVNGDGRADIVGFGNAGAYVSLGQPDGTFAAPVLAVANFGHDAGGWRVPLHPRALADVNGDNRADVVGFGNAGAYVSLGGQPTPHNLVVSRFTTSALTDADADRILADATTVLRVGESAADSACNVAFSRSGTVGAFATGNGIVNSQADFAAIIAVGGDVKVVNAINWCGRPGAGIIGCAPTPGGSLAVVRFSTNQEGILWAHEFGHNQGLPHRDGNTLVMNPFITTTGKEVNAGECGAFRGPTPATEAAAVVLSAEAAGGAGPSAAAAAGTVRSEQEVEAFVRRHYAHGVPYNEARRFAPEVAPTLLRMLGDPNEKDYWANIVGVLGIVGDASAAEPLIAFVERNAGSALDPAAYRASLSALIALGYLANRTGDQRAVDFLAGRARALGAAGAAPANAPGELRLDAESLGQTAVLGLAVSGRPRAREVLEELMRSDAARVRGQGAEAAANSPSQNLLSEALTTHGAVETQGLAEYYRREGR